MTVQKIIIMLMMLAIIILSYRFGTSIETNGKSTIDFCYSHYRNDTFLETVKFNGEDSAQPKECDDSQWRTGWYQYCNSTCFDNYDKCLEQYATKEQIEFMKCHWLGADYFIMAGTLFFKYLLPIGNIAILISVIYSVKLKKWLGETK